MAMSRGSDTTEKLTFSAKEIFPGTLVFRNTAIVPGSGSFPAIKSTRPSPSKSAAANPQGPFPEGNDTAGKKELVANARPLENVGTKALGEYAVNPCAVTVSAAYEAPIGTVTLSELLVALETIAFTPPK